MDKIVLILLLLLMVGGCQSTGTSDPKPTSASTSTSTSTSTPLSGSSATLIVHGMGCPMCANNIDRQLLRVRGVQKVDVDLGSGAVSVKFAPDAHPAREQIVAAVEQSGFTLREIRQP